MEKMMTERSKVGTLLGVSDGDDVGATEGANEGARDGTSDGTVVGASDGVIVGANEGISGKDGGPLLELMKVLWTARRMERLLELQKGDLWEYMRVRLMEPMKELLLVISCNRWCD